MRETEPSSGGKMPKPRCISGVERLSPSLSEPALFERFMREFGDEESAVVTDMVGHELIIDASLFLDLKGRWKIQKGERAKWLLFTAINIQRPDEIWLEPGRRGGPDKRYYLS
ncbi:PBECR2 nuclease fold domain-containing protein [Halochromatium roseum]|uniref:PBECR2 nuclease fold domain-containing protein n=1 Tax=Halochromatium roseum TaxID=391920 RepID=UPI0019121326|nr:PBECR2 nuclease fold domain-containing protein [Halochromatium roseum]MBK5940536.1 hypothetical protein [Halochromatium roseum]